MKLAAAFGALLLLAPAARAGDVGFEPSGVKVQGAVVTGSVLEVKGSLLVSGSVIEPLASEVSIDLAAGRVLTLEPGVRVVRTAAGYSIQTHGRQFVRFEAGEESFEAEAPVALAPTATGWDLGGRALEGGLLRVNLQDKKSDADADVNIESLQEAARKMERARQQPGRRAPERRKRPMRRRVFTEDPFITSEVASSATMRFIIQLPVSPAGF